MNLPRAGELPFESKNSVAVGPGQTARTLTPVFLVSPQRASVKDRTKALVAPYTAMYGSDWKAAVDAMLITIPSLRSTIPGRNAWVSSTKVLTFTVSSSTMNLLFSLMNSAVLPKPALFTRMSICVPRPFRTLARVDAASLTLRSIGSTLAA